MEKKTRKQKQNIIGISKKDKLEIINNILLQHKNINSQKEVLNILNDDYIHDIKQPNLSKYFKELKIVKHGESYKLSDGERQSFLEKKIKKEFEQVIGDISIYNDVGLIFLKLDDNNKGQARIHNISHMLKFTYNDIIGALSTDEFSLLITKNKESALKLTKKIESMH